MRWLGGGHDARGGWCGAGHLDVGAGTIKRAGLLLAVIGAAVIGMSGSAAASSGGPAYSKEQAGYSVTGARFSVVEVNITLPDAGRFAADAGQVGFSVQLWTKRELVDLRVYACTDASCQPGGKPADREYRLAFTRYSRSTRTVLCTTTNSSCFATRVMNHPQASCSTRPVSVRNLARRRGLRPR